MTRKAVLFSLVWFAVVLAGAVTLVHADSELAAIQAALHEHGRMWVAGETAISKLPAHERATRARLIKPQATGREQVIRQGAAELTDLTPTLDWRNNGGNFVTPIRDQGNCGSCWAFATTAALESFLLISQPTIFNQQSLDVSEQILVTCGGAGSCNGGYIDRASNYVRDTGLPPEYLNPTSYVYQPSTTTCPAGWPVAGQAEKSQGWAWVTTTSVSVNTLKNALATYGPLITTMDVYQDFFSYTSGVYQYSWGTRAGAHAILIVGYADDTSIPAWGGGYFIVKNSWGTTWGEKNTPEAGFFRIAYSETASKVLFGEWTIANANTAPACTFSISPTSTNVLANPGSGSANVNASAGTCGWTASTNSSWISVSPTSGTGSRTVNYSYDQNTGSARTGRATIAGKTFTVNQAAADIPIIAVSPTSLSFGPVRAGTTSTKNVTISNKGGTALATAITIGGNSASDFGLTSGCESIVSNGSCAVQVTFKPSSRTSKSASLIITSNDPVHRTVSVPLSGKGN